MNMEPVVEIVGCSPAPHPCCGEVYGHESWCVKPTDARVVPLADRLPDLPHLADALADC